MDEFDFDDEDFDDFDSSGSGCAEFFGLLLLAAMAAVLYFAIEVLRTR